MGTDYEQIGRDLSEGAEYDRAKNQFVYQTDLLKRLENAERRMGAICSERRGPRMSIPAKPYDDDLFICAALRDARQQLSTAQTTAPSPLSPTTTRNLACIKLHLEIAEVSKRTQALMPSIVNFKDALRRLAEVEAAVALSARLAEALKEENEDG